MVARALTALKAGQPILLYDADGREEETDIIVASQFVTPDLIFMLRRHAGGLICTAVSAEVHDKLGLPFAADMVSDLAAKYPVLAGMGALENDRKYDTAKSSFGISLNSRKTFTGITDLDRSLTIRELTRFITDLDAMTAEEAQIRFGQEFRSPGHAVLLNGAKGGVSNRQGHTELSLELVRMVGLLPSSTMCEMLDGVTGKALNKAAATGFAERNDLAMISGSDVVRALDLE